MLVLFGYGLEAKSLGLDLNRDFSFENNNLFYANLLFVDVFI